MSFKRRCVMKSCDELKAGSEATQKSMVEVKYDVNKVLAIHMQIYAELNEKELLYETANK